MHEQYFSLSKMCLLDLSTHARIDILKIFLTIKGFVATMLAFLRNDI